MTHTVKVWAIRDKDRHAVYDIEFAGDIDSFSSGNALWLIKEARRKFKIAGTMFLVFIPNRVYFVTKLPKEWVAYEYIAKDTQS